MIDIPPGKYFISHSYKDAEVRDDIKKLPDGVKPLIFPAISVSPLLADFPQPVPGFSV